MIARAFPPIGVIITGAFTLTGALVEFTANLSAYLPFASFRRFQSGLAYSLRSSSFRPNAATDAPSGTRPEGRAVRRACCRKLHVPWACGKSLAETWATHRSYGGIRCGQPGNFAISISCDSRYLYTLELSAMMAPFYLILDARHIFEASR